jgi:hypothetical protein
VRVQLEELPPALARKLAAQVFPAAQAEMAGPALEAEVVIPSALPTPARR